MLFERSDLTSRPIRHRSARRVWDGFVRGLPDCWIVVARDEDDLLEWAQAEEFAIEAAPLRICRAILDDDVVVLADTGTDEDLDLIQDPA